MARGCLLWVVVYAVVWFLEHQQLQALPYATALATALALGVTLWLGSLQGLAQALRQRAQPPADPSQWRDGQPVRISGLVLPSEETARAPISGAPAVFCSYMGKMADNELAIASNQAPHWHGQVAVPCVLSTGTLRLPLLGIPSLRHLPQTVYRGRPHVVNAARHLAGTGWAVAPHVGQVDLADLAQAFEAGYAGLPAHLINTAALERLQMRIGRSTEAELLRQLEANDWHFGERVLPPGAEVTLEGTYQAMPPAIDIGYSARQAAHALHLGGAARTANRQLVTTLVFVVVLGLLTAAAHHAVYAQQGALYRSALQGLGLVE